MKVGQEVEYADIIAGPNAVEDRAQMAANAAWQVKRYREQFGIELGEPARIEERDRPDGRRSRHYFWIVTKVLG